MIIRFVIQVIAPLLSLFMTMLGNGLYNTLIAVRLDMDGATNWLIGLASAAFYAGFVISSLRVDSFIVRVGHIRAFSIFAALTAIVSLIPGMTSYHLSWIVMRFIAGFCLAGIYVIIESWLLADCSSKNRGKILSVYMITLYSGQMLGQFLLKIGNPLAITQFCITAIIASLSIIPVCITYRKSPTIAENPHFPFRDLFRISPTGIFGCFISGMMLGPIYGLIPAFARSINYSINDIAFTMFIILLGGMLLQYPMGSISDRIGRRTVLLALALSATLLSISMVFSAVYSQWLFWMESFIFGGVCFTLYPLSISQTCDYIEPDKIISAVGSLVLSYGIGATLGPLVAPLLMDYINDSALFFYFAAMTGFFFLFILIRMCRRTSLPLEEQSNYVSIPQTTAHASELNPLVDTNQQEKQ